VPPIFVLWPYFAAAIEKKLGQSKKKGKCQIKAHFPAAIVKECKGADSRTQIRKDENKKGRPALAQNKAKRQSAKGVRKNGLHSDYGIIWNGWYVGLLSCFRGALRSCFLNQRIFGLFRADIGACKARSAQTSTSIRTLALMPQKETRHEKCLER
jgi:hypothetical protein